MTTTAMEPTVGAALRPIEIGAGLWALVPGGKLDDEAAEELRDACVEALDRGAETLVVDLTAVTAIGLEALDVLAACSSSLLACGGLLWLAGGNDEHDAIELAPVDDAALETLSRTLDERSGRRV